MGYPLQQTPEPAWADLWGAVRDRLRLDFGQGIFDTWIAPLSFASVQDGHVRLSAPSRLVRDYVASHHAARVERAFAALTPDFASLEIVIATADLRATTSVKLSQVAVPTSRNPMSGAGAPGKTPSASLQGLWDRQPDPSQSFANFVVGPSNEFAFKAAQRFAE